jgi:hypothetical protein
MSSMPTRLHIEALLADEEAAESIRDEEAAFQWFALAVFLLR